MHRRIIAILVCSAFLLSSPGFAQDRDASSRDLEGIHKSSRKYFWAVAGGTAVGLGLGIIAPGGSKSAFKGALIGGSATSAFYLIKDPNAAGNQRGFAHIVTNTLLGTGIFWTVCNCKAGAWSGAFIGGGGTAIIQAFGTHNRNLAKLGGVASTTPSTPATPSEPANANTPVVAGQQNAPAQPATQSAQAPVQTQNSPAQATTPAATQNSQSAPAAAVQNAPAQGDSTATQSTTAPSQNAAAPAQSAPVSTPSAPAQTQSIPASTPSVPGQAQSTPASTQSDPAGTQAIPAQNQNPPLDPEELTFSSDSNRSASLQTTQPRPQGQRP